MPRAMMPGWPGGPGCRVGRGSAAEAGRATGGQTGRTASPGLCLSLGGGRLELLGLFVLFLDRLGQRHLAREDELLDVGDLQRSELPGDDRLINGGHQGFLQLLGDDALMLQLGVLDVGVHLLGGAGGHLPDAQPLADAHHQGVDVAAGVGEGYDVVVVLKVHVGDVQHLAFAPEAFGVDVEGFRDVAQLGLDDGHGPAGFFDV